MDVAIPELDSAANTYLFPIDIRTRLVINRIRDDFPTGLFKGLYRSIHVGG